GAQVHGRTRLRPDHKSRWSDAYDRRQHYSGHQPHAVGGGQVRRKERPRRGLDDLPDPRHHRDAGGDRGGADQPSRAAAHWFRRAGDPSGGGGDRQRDLRRHRGAHPPRAVLARSGQAVAVVTVEMLAADVEADSVYSLSPFLRGEGWGEGLLGSPRDLPLTPTLPPLTRGEGARRVRRPVCATLRS